MADEPKLDSAPQAPQAQPEPVAPVAPTPAPAPQPEPVVQPAQPQPLPEDASARTREQYEKLIESNRRLYEANELLRQELHSKRETQQTFQPIQQQPVQQQQNAPLRSVDPKDYIETDPETGDKYINEQKLQAAIDELAAKASRAESTVNSYIQQAEQREIERQNREAFNQYPELNPQDEKFNYAFHQQVRGLLYDSMINTHEYGGRPLSFKEAADFIKAQYPQAMPSNAPTAGPDPVVEQAKAEATQALKEQASTQPTGQQPAQQRQSYESDSDLRALQEATRMGSDEALAKRLINTPHILPPDAEIV